MLLDFGGTLDADGVHWAPRFHQAYRAAGSALTIAAFEPLFAESDRRLARLPGIRTLGYRAMIEAQVAILQHLLASQAAADPSRIAEAFHSAAVATVARNRPVLERLAKGYRMAVVSNFTGNLERCLAELNLLPLFSVVLDSAVVGISKPQPGIFSAALSRLGIPPERAWMVGDNFHADVLPAAGLGLKTCWVAPAERELPSAATPTIPTARIERFDRIEAVLAGR